MEQADGGIKVTIGAKWQRRFGDNSSTLSAEPRFTVGEESAAPWRFSHANIIRRVSLAADLERIHADCHGSIPGEVNFQLEKIKRDRVRFVGDDDDLDKRIYLRLYHFCGRISWAPAGPFRFSRAIHERRVSEKMKEMGVTCPEILASGILRRGPMPVGSYLIIRHMAGWRTVKSIIDEDAEGTEVFRSERGFERIAEFFHMLSENGALMKQVGTGHILLPVDDYAARFGMMDLEHMALMKPPLSPAYRIAVIARLNLKLRQRKFANDDDRARLFRRYAELDADPRISGADFESFDQIVDRIRVPRAPRRGAIAGRRLLGKLSK